jgi:hypothetical protein
MKTILGRDGMTGMFATALLLAIGAGAVAPVSWAALLRGGAAESMSRAAAAWIDTLDAQQKISGVRPFTEATRTDWHFVPKPTRKGVQLRDMTAAQQEAALALLRTALSQSGYDKSVVIMSLEEILRRLEGAKAKNIRDDKRYFFTVFGTPAETGSWGLSVEGHHLSFNFTVRDGTLVDSTPQFMGSNPATVKTTFPGLPAAGHRVIADEETLAFELVNSLAGPRRTQAVIAAEPPKEIRAAGVPQPPEDAPVGIRYGDLTPDQQSLLRRLVEAYCSWMPAEVATERLRLIETSGAVAATGAVHHGWDEIRFAWAGALKPGVGHYYRVEGPTFLIEFANAQPAAEGTPANHIHCVWRDKTGDFDLPAK